MQIKDLGEQGILQIVQKFCPPDIIGDDGAILNFPNSRNLVVTSDMLVDDVHFSDRTTTAFDAGWRATAVNLSDLAAMGAEPLGITVALGLPASTEVNWLEQLYQGITSCLEQYRTPIVGGDLVRSPIKTIAITAFGHSRPDFKICRHVAKVNQVIVATGLHGLAKAGLEILLKPEIADHLSDQVKQKFIQAHQRPQPRLDVLKILGEILVSESLPRQFQPQPIAIAGMDSSDGLADAITQICRASKVGAYIDGKSIPIPVEMQKLVSEKEAINWALYGGEDFQLVLCLPIHIGKKLVQKLQYGATIVGVTTACDTDIVLVDNQGLWQKLTSDRSFQHF